MQQPEPEQQATDIQPREAASQQEAAPSVEQQLAEAERQKQTCLDSLLRAQADFANYKRRAAQEQAEGRMAATGEMLDALVPVLDDVGRALEAAPAELAEQPWVQGIHLVSRQLAATLQRLGVRQIGSPGEPFDPHWHEAVLTESRSDVPEGTVVRVTRPGYAQGERILRPAEVVVAAAPEAAAAQSPSRG